jgi:DNA-binding XRE family transcriptional regulator
MMNAYSKIYLDDAMSNLAIMLDYAAMAYGDPEVFFDRFLVSDISKQFGDGSPRYISGMSGVELAERVIEETGGTPVYAEYRTSGRSANYWTGWALAYLQWYTGYSFEKIKDWGITIPCLLSLYPTHHEADITKLIDTASEIIAESQHKNLNPLKRQRMSARLTQLELAQKSGVKLRMIQAYEQNYQDITKAEVGTMLRLARTLSCNIEDLLT